MDKNLVQLAVDSYKGVATGEYSTSERSETIRKAMIEMNGGSAVMDYRAIRDGKCNGLFAYIEDVLTQTVIEGLPEGNPLFDFVEQRNLKEGDQQKFLLEGKGSFIVSEIADGTQGLRRQRLNAGEEITVKTKKHGVKIYEELTRVLAGRVDFNKFIDMVAEAFIKQITEEMYEAVVAGFAGLATPYAESGSFNEATLLKIVDHVEAATGQTAIILGSKQAVRKITGITGADAKSAKEDLYAMGYFGHIGENAVVTMKNGHKAGTTDFILGNDLYIIAADDKFVKYVTEGESLIIPGNPTDNQDLSQEFLTIQCYGIKAIMSAINGVYRLS